MIQKFIPQPGGRTVAVIVLAFVGTWAAVLTLIGMIIYTRQPGEAQAVNVALLTGIVGLVSAINIPLITGQVKKSNEGVRNYSAIEIAKATSTSAQTVKEVIA